MAVPLRRDQRFADRAGSSLIMTQQKTEWTRTPLILSFPDNPKFNET